MAALGRLFIRGDWNAVAALIGDGPNPASRTAACVVTACMLMDAERHAEAVTLLSEQPDDASPVDWAWMMTQRARARAEFGDVASARQDAAAALRALVGDQDDVTASAIEASAAELLFQTAPWGEQPLDELITAIDTAVSWWRMQPLSTALREAADRTFRQWADEQATRIEFDDTVNDQLYAAVLSADMTGAQGAFQANGSLLARNTLMAGHAQRDTNRQADGLDALRRSGDEKSLDLAARRLWEVGPLGPLAEAARRIQPSSWTHTAARANLMLWQHAGDVLDTPTATAAARFCLEVLSDDAAFIARTTPSFLVAPCILDALAGLIDAASDAVHLDLAGVLASLPPVTDQLRALGWAQVAARLRATVLAAPQDRAGLRQAAAAQLYPGLAAAILGLLADHDAAARQLLLARIASGDAALAALGDVPQLSAEVAGRLMTQDAELLDSIIAEARSGVHTMWTRDPAARLAFLGSHFPEVAPWDVLLSYLSDICVAGDRKRSGCLVLAQHAGQLPERVKSDLHDLIPQLAPSSSPLGMFGSPLGGAAMVLAASVGALDDQELAGSVAGLLTGSRQERRDAAALIGRLDQPKFTSALVALLSDPYPDVRAAAARVLAIRVANPDTSVDAFAITGLQRALVDPGALTPLAIASAIRAIGTPSDRAAEFVVPLRGHPSALVRKAAA